MKGFKKVAALVLSGSLVMGLGLSANAAGLKDLFNAEYYANQYADLKAAFGYDEELLYTHFLEYGLKEGREEGNTSYIVAQEAAKEAERQETVEAEKENRVEYEYNDDGNVVVKSVYDGKDYLIERYFYSPDGSYDKTRTIEVRHDETEYGYTTFVVEHWSYDAQRNEVAHRRDFEAGNSDIVVQFSESGLLECVLYYTDCSNSTLIKKYVYDANGDYCVYEYDTDGITVIKSTECNKDGSVKVS